MAMNPNTLALLNEFSTALCDKLEAAERKYGYHDNWLTEDWEAECRAKLMRHIEKGDPLDVAAYTAFMWKRGWSTAAAAASLNPAQRAYALLWSDTGAKSPEVKKARAVLLEALTKDEQRDAIGWIQTEAAKHSPFADLKRLTPEEVAAIPPEKPDPDYIRRNTQLDSAHQCPVCGINIDSPFPCEHAPV